MREQNIVARPVWFTLAMMAAAASAGFTGLYFFPQWQAINRGTAMAASFIPYAILGWVLATILTFASTRGRGRLLGAVALVGTLTHGLILTGYVTPASATPTAAGKSVTVLALNLRFGLADLDQLKEQIDRTRPDLVVLTEVTDHVAAAVQGSAWTSLLPYHSGTSGKDRTATDGGSATGTLVLSRTPLTEIGRTTDTSFTCLAVRTTVAGTSLVLVAAHPVNPVYGVSNWMRDGNSVAELAARWRGQPLILAGDLNAVAEHLTLRTIEQRANLHQVSTGWLPTYPNDRWFPPLIQIDHILASPGFSTVSAGSFDVAGTDHRGITAELVGS